MKGPKHQHERDDRRGGRAGDDGPDSQARAVTPRGPSKEAVSGGQPSPTDVRAELDRILASPDFRASQRRRQLLRYVVEAGLAGRADRLKGYTVATEVFGRDETFDPQTDPIVRMEIRRLRQDLEHYYLTSGRDDPVQISIPKGGNAPTFEGRAEGHADEAPEEQPAGHPSPERTRTPTGRRPWRWIAAAGAAVLLVAGLLWQWPITWSPDPDGAPSHAGGRTPGSSRGPSIAVLPFRSLGGEPDQEYFSDGITEDVVTGLGRFHHLFVLARRATLRYRDDTADPQEIGRQLGVDYLLEGSVGRSLDRIQITARLVDTGTGGLLWGESDHRELRPDQIFQVLEEVAQRVSAAIGSRHGVYAALQPTAHGRPPRSIDAYECMSRYISNAGAMTPERHRRSRACLEQAVADDPGYANGWAVLSTVYSVEHRQGFLPGPGEYDPLARSLEYARRAVTLDAGNATAHGALAVARFHLHDLEAFKSECERAREHNPSDSDTLARCGMRLAFTGDWDRGLASMKRAMELNPEHYGSYHVPFALHHYERGEYERALEQVQKMNLPRFFWSQMIRGMALGQLDRRDEAQAAVQKLVELKPGIREEFWGITRDWNFPDPLVERFADGLRKAGLDLAPRPADLGS